MCPKISTRIFHPGFSKPSSSSSSSSSPRKKTAAKRSRILDLLIIIIIVVVVIVVATPLNTAKGGDVSSWVHSSHRVLYNDLGEAESLYLGFGGNPWGSSSTSIYLRNHRRILSSFELRNGSTTAVASRNDKTDNGAATEYAVITGPGSTLRRSKRGVLHLYNMVLCATGCNPLAYKGYGCYCGFLGSGFTIDGIDRCCKMHDWCYGATDCLMFSEYIVPYYWKCYRGYKPICAVEHGDFGAAGSCAQRLCECDRELAECLRRYPCPRTKAMCTSSSWRLVQNIFMLL